MKKRDSGCRTVVLAALAAGLLACGGERAAVPACEPGETQCKNGVLYKCGEEGDGFVPYANCQYGCKDDKQCLAKAPDSGTAGDAVGPEAVEEADAEVMEEAGTWPEEVPVIPPEVVEEPPVPEETGCDQCQPDDFYCSGIKIIYWCKEGPDGCRRWDQGQPCDDGNPCTDDACSATKGCVTADAMGPCDDGDPCTQGDQCKGGQCVPGPSACQCKTDSDCLPLEDGDLCNGTLMCQDAECVTKPGSAVQCPPPDACKGYTCDPATGQCLPKPVSDGLACDDKDACTIQDACKGGKCKGQPVDCSWLDEPCVKGICSGGKCEETHVPGACDDGDPATCFDQCKDGNCVGGPCDIHGETCADAIDLGPGGTFEADLCLYHKDYDFPFCELNGPDLFFKVKALYLNGAMQMDTSGSFPGMTMALRLWEVSHCDNTGANYGCGGSVSWSGPLGLTNHLFFVVSSKDGTCGKVKISAYPKESK